MTEAFRTPVAAIDMATPLELIEEAREGRMFILLNHERAESVGALVLPSRMVSAAGINFMATHGRGLVYLTLTEERAAALGLGRLPTRYKQSNSAAFTVSIEAKDGITTGISAFDRAHTIRVATDPNCNGDDIVTPGHIFPLMAKRGGVLIRPGVTEGSVDICRLAGLEPSAVICEILGEDGRIAGTGYLQTFAAAHGLKIGSLNDLIAYRSKNDSTLVECGREAVSSTFGGDWTVIRMEDTLTGLRHIALTKGDLAAPGPVTARVHVLDAMADVLGIDPEGRKCAIRTAMERIGAEGRGALVLLHGAALSDDRARLDTNGRLDDFGLGAQILAAMGLSDLHILVQSALPQLVNLQAFGLRICSTEELATSD